jgi:RimJ/RimL family protein N-acetyltransferase
MKVEEWMEAYADQVATWSYEPPYGLLDAFWYFNWHGDVTEVGIGLRPDLKGRGRGQSFLLAQLDYAAGQWQPTTFRLFVAAWNERAIRLYERLGFREVARETRHFELVGDHEFIRMERAA